MRNYKNYFLMKESDVIGYAKETLDFFDQDPVLAAKEIGDGNLNYVFRVVEPATGKSVIIKQAGEALRISSIMKVSTDRNRIESEMLQIQDTYASGLVPKIYKYDTIMCACAMEDLSDYTLMREALMKHHIFPRFAEDISTYMVNTLLKTTDIVMDHKAKKSLVKNFINPDLCEITEDLVFTEPYNNMQKRNLVFEPNAKFVEEELYNDTSLQLEVAKIKFDFMNNSQALIHGDLHTGSIFIKSDSTRVFDPEFAFYGPMGYDIGNIIANLIFAWDNGFAANAVEFINWIEKTIIDIVNLFKMKFTACFKENVTDIMAKTPGFCEWYLGTILRDTAAMAGTELIRRTVGLAQVKDITTITNEAMRIRLERINIFCGKQLIMERSIIKTGDDFINILKQAVYKTKQRRNKTL